MDKIELLLQDLLKGFVNYPDDVATHVSTDSDDKGELSMINVRVHKDDVGLCIGEKGKTAEAIRRIISLAGFRQMGTRVYVKIDAPKIPKDHFNYQPDAVAH